MPTRYRVIIALIGASLSLGGAVGILFGYMAPESLWYRVRGIGGGIVAVVLGVSLVAASYKGRIPAWLAAFFGDMSDIS